jgi:hypothetical protein
MTYPALKVLAVKELLLGGELVERLFFGDNKNILSTNLNYFLKGSIS